MRMFLFFLVFLSSFIVYTDDFNYKIYPQLITPNNDGSNDILVFLYKKAPYYPNVAGKIYDLLGREIAGFKVERIFSLSTLPLVRTLIPNPFL